MSKLAAFAAISLFALAGSASAQGGPGGGMPDRAEMEAHMAEHRAQMDKDMHVILRLRPDQEAAWRAFRDATLPSDGAPRDMMFKGPKPGLTTPQRLDEMDRMAAEHQARHARMQAALRTFYAALSPEQQAVFDALHRMHGPGGPGGPHMPMMGGPGGGPMMDRRIIIHGGPE